MRRRETLWFAIFVLMVIILIISIGLIVPLVILANKTGLISIYGTFPVLPCIGVAFITITIGAVIFAILSSSIFEPIYELRRATKEVAKGNFNIQIPERKEDEVGQLIKDFNKMVAELKNIDTLQNNFMADVSHEFKTPIASIEGYAELLKNDNLTEAEKKEYVEMISTGVHRLSVLTSNVLKLSKIENTEILMDQKEIQLDEQIRNCILMLEPKWSEKNIDLDIELQPTVFYCNEEILSHVWINLIDNAIKFSNQNGKVSVLLYDDDENFIVKIVDEGIGMSEDVQKHIFDKFYQGDNNRSMEGNGLGLALVKKITEAYGGTIDVKSTVGEGSTFTVSFNKFRVIDNKK